MIAHLAPWEAILVIPAVLVMLKRLAGLRVGMVALPTSACIDRALVKAVVLRLIIIGGVFVTTKNLT